MSKEQQKNQKQMAHNRKAGTRKKKTRNKVMIFVLEIIVLLILAIVLYGVNKLSKIERTELNMDDVVVNEDLASETIEVMDNYRTIALFGLDNRSNGNLSSGRSDVIMVATINNDTQEVKLCSVYRDTYLDTGNGIFKKCNSAYSDGGPEAAISMLNKNLDLSITDYVTVDFNAVVECVDLLGGVEITVDDEEARLMQGYQDEINKLTKNKSPYLPGAGTYNMDGVQACSYARIRYTAGDDYKRTERQRLVLSAMVEKAQRSDLKTINSLIDKVFGDIQTSFSNTDLVGLAAQVFNYKIADSAGFPFLKGTSIIGSKGSVVIPCSLESNVVSLHEFLYEDTAYVASDTVLANSKKIINDTGMDEGDGY